MKSLLLSPILRAVGDGVVVDTTQQPVEVSARACAQSRVLSTYSTEAEGNVVPLRATRDMLVRVVRFMNRAAEDIEKDVCRANFPARDLHKRPGVHGTVRESIAAAVPEWYANWVMEDDPKNSIQVLRLANSLGHSRMVQLLLLRVYFTVIGRTVDQVKQEYGYTKTLSSEEEQALSAQCQFAIRAFSV